jgi:hypothetical protein
VNDQKIELAVEVNYLGVSFVSNGGWKRQNLKTVAKGNQTLIAVDTCLARTPVMKVKILENV